MAIETDFVQYAKLLSSVADVARSVQYHIDDSKENIDEYTKRLEEDPEREWIKDSIQDYEYKLQIWSDILESMKKRYLKA